MATVIEDLLNNIRNYIDNSKFKAFSVKKIIVDKEIIEKYLEELRIKMPEEIEKYKEVINNKNAILSDAKMKADNILQETRNKAEELINKEEIVLKAQEQAKEIIEEAKKNAKQIIEMANKESNTVRKGSIEYSDEILKKSEMIIGQILDEYVSKNNEFLKLLKDDYNIIIQNRKELESIKLNS